MPDQIAIQRGRDFEQRIANIFSGKLQPGSGNKFYAQGDIVANGMAISCKSEVNLSWGKVVRHLYEAIEMSYQVGNIPVLALDGIEDDDIIVMRVSDLVKALQEEIKIPEYHESKGLQKRSTAEVPLMLRE
jgi:hypothetical protein